MGQRGPSPEPTALKVLKGDRPSRINRAEPVPAGGMPPAPKSLSIGARYVWKRLAKDLHAKGLLTIWDRDAFQVYCELIAAFHTATRELNVREQKELAGTIRQYAREFGLTPSARQAFVVEREAQQQGSREELLS